MPTVKRPSRRILSVWLPRLATDRLATDRLQSRAGGKGGPPLVLTMPVNGRPVIAAADAAAAAGGIVPGMPLGDARALLPMLRVLEADPAGTARDLERLADWCGRYSPIVAVDGADGLLIDTSGCDHLFGGEAGLCRDLTRRIAGMGLAVRAALADTPGAAWAVARYGSQTQDEKAGNGAGQGALVAPGAARAALAPLPVAALRLAQPVVEALSQVGLKRIDDLLPLPRAPLARRFGPDVGRRLDLALGAAFEPVSPRQPVPPWRLRMAFPEPLVRHEDAAVVARRLVGALCERLERERLGVRDLTLTFYRADGGVTRATLGTGRASRDPAHLLGLLREPLAGLDLGSVPGHGAEAAVLSAVRVEPLSARQLGLSAESADREGGGTEAMAELVDRLTHRLGPQAVVRPVLRQSHVPERAVANLPPLEAPGAPLSGSPSRSAEAADEWPRFRGLPSRPLRLLSRPEPIEAMSLLPDSPPAMFYWRRIPHRVRHADGPERIAPEWWRAGPAAGEPDPAWGEDDAATRDYYRLEVEGGRRFWVFRRGLYRPGAAAAPAWYLHGLFA